MKTYEDSQGNMWDTSGRWPRILGGAPPPVETGSFVASTQDPPKEVSMKESEGKNILINEMAEKIYVNSLSLCDDRGLTNGCSPEAAVKAAREFIEYTDKELFYDHNED